MNKQTYSLALALSLATALPLAATSTAQAGQTANAVALITNSSSQLVFDPVGPMANKAEVRLIKKGGRSGKRGSFGRSRGFGKHGRGADKHGARARGGESSAVRGLPQASSQNIGPNFFERLLSF